MLLALMNALWDLEIIVSMKGSSLEYIIFGEGVLFPWLWRSGT
jgi:hypothetical protein